MNADPVASYEAVAAAAQNEIATTTAAATRASWARLGAATVATAALAGGYSTRISSPLAWGVAAAATMAFGVAVWRHRRFIRRRLTAQRRADSADWGLARIRRQWDRLSGRWESAVALSGRRAALAEDLGVVGAHALARLLPVTHPTLGGERLLTWLLDDPATVETVYARQTSVAALREHPTLLLAAAVRRLAGAPATARGLTTLRAWCGAEPANDARRDTLTRTLSGLCTVAVVSAFAAGGQGRPGAVGVVAAVVQLTLAARARRWLRTQLAGVDAVLAHVAGVADSATLVVTAERIDGRFGEVQRLLRDDGAPAAFSALRRLLEWNEMRLSPAAHWLANATVSFDVHLAAAVRRWRATHGARVPAWLDAVADADALLALGTLAYEHPAWTRPTLDDAPDKPLTATALAHPLLPPDAVANDVTLGASQVLVVSGPNMAGKTTLLRAVGLNVLLAQAGSVVRAGTLRLGRCRPRSSVRVADDLGSGVSLFLAEVTRLRDVIADAETQGKPSVLFLFDEVLHGTNAADRRAATRAVLARLAAAGALGLVTTHDPTIGEGIAPARQLHFDGDVRRAADGAITLHFDYRVHDGPAHRANARDILAMMGIDASEPPASEPPASEPPGLERA